MQKRIRILVLLAMLPAVLLIPAGPVVSEVGPEALANCKELAFSTEEDFVTGWDEPPPDGNPIISDGDLLGVISSATGAPTCAICARNADLLAQTFDVTFDLGLDAADVIDIDGYLVAFSTELDSPHNAGTAIQFTAGDLLVTTLGIIIPNQALTYKWSVGYDIGLDAVQFVGSRDAILQFLREAESFARDAYLETPDLLVGMLAQYGIDIWFSTEGTLGPVDKPVFLDGDLLSARDGTIKASNSVLLPPGVPAGIVDRGVDFGLDAVANDRSSEVDRRIHFSTEILFKETFTDGDMLQFGNGVVATNYDLIQCFLPEAKELGLDALSLGVQELPPECVSRITDIAGVDVGDIDPTTGLAYPGTVGAIDAPVPFGGWIDIGGTICEDVQDFRILYRQAGSGNPWTPIPVLDTPTTDWKVKVDAFFPWGPDCLGKMDWYSDGLGWFDGVDYRHLTEAGLGGCNPGLALTVWESAAVPLGLGGPEALHEIVLATLTMGGTVVSDTVRLVQLDNTAPETHLKKEAGVCNTVTSMPLMIEGRMDDAHFHSYQLRITGDGYGIYPYPVVEYYDILDPGAANLDATGTLSWPNNVQLHEVDLNDLHTPAIACGYSVLLTAWDRTLVCNFKFPTNQAYHCPGCRHTGDAWTFNYEPATP